MYYVIPDIHGRNDLLQMALTAIYEKSPTGGKIVFLGDYIDRGPENAMVLKTVMNPPERWEFVTLRGNHEDMFVDGYTGAARYYDRPAYNEIKHSGIVSIEEAGEWMKSLPYTHTIGHNIFAHAAYDAFKPDDQQNPHQVVWLRYTDTEPFLSPNNNMFLTHGHTPRANAPIMSPNRMNLDGGAVFYGRLVVAVFEEDEMGPQEFLQFFGKDWDE